MSTANTALLERQGFHEILRSEDYLKYKGFILDLWGVVNSDTGHFPDAIRAIQKLRHDGKELVIVSNTPHRRSETEKKLTGFGLEKGRDYKQIITSGDMAYHYFQEHRNDFSTGSYYLIGNGGASDKLLNGLEGYSRTEDIKAADFILCTAAPDKRQNPEELKPELQALLDVRSAAGLTPLTLYSANPDLQAPDSSENRIYCGGAVAKAYEEIGGAIHTFGKPEKPIYEAALAELGMDESEVLAIGDTLETDIAGAQNAGIDSMLVRNEMHMHGIPEGAYAKPTGMEWLTQRCHELGLRPNYVVPFFSVEGHELAYSSFPEVIPYFDGLMMDMWGVTNDDKDFFPEAIEAIKDLSKAGKKIVFISNTPYPSDVMEDKLRSFGLEKGKHYAAVVTSGDIAYEHCLRHKAPAKTQKYIVIGREESSYKLLEGMEGYEMIDKPLDELSSEDLQAADFVLCTSSPQKNLPPRLYLNQLLGDMAAHDLPMYNVNPDYETPQMDRKKVYCGGSIARLYAEKFEGKVITFGKPEQPIYEKAMKVLDMPKSRVLAISSTLGVDGLGASKFGIAFMAVKNPSLPTHERDLYELVKQHEPKGVEAGCHKLRIPPPMRLIDRLQPFADRVNRVSGLAMTR